MAWAFPFLLNKWLSRKDKNLTLDFHLYLFQYKSTSFLECPPLTAQLFNYPNLLGLSRILRALLPHKHSVVMVKSGTFVTTDCFLSLQDQFSHGVSAVSI